MGRQWESADGNLYASTIIRLRADDPTAASLAFVAALAAFETVQQIAPEVPIQIKWPNDLLTAAGEKFCGMLLERSGDAIVLGVGMNLFLHPSGIGRPVTDLRASGGHPPHAQAVTEMLAGALRDGLAQWRAGGLALILTRWQRHAHPVGTALSVTLPDGTSQQGDYAGLENDGALRLRLANGEIRAIHAADIFLI